MTPALAHGIRDHLTVILLCLEELDRELPGRADIADARLALARILDSLPLTARAGGT